MDTAKSEIKPLKASTKQSFGLTVVNVLLGLLFMSIIAFNQSPRLDPYILPTVWEKLFKPQELNAHMRLATISGDVSDVFVLADSDFVWAVGDKGLIIHSQDGGITWQQQRFPDDAKIKLSATENLIDDLSAIRTNTSSKNKKELFAAKMAQLNNISKQQYKALDVQQSAITQKQQTVDQTAKQTQEITKVKKVKPTLYSVYFADKDTGWITGYRGTLLKTNNGGESWISQNSGTDEWLYDIDFSDNQIGIIVGSRGIILTTSNGGKTWISQSSGTTNRLNAVAFNNSKTAVAVGDFGTIIKTSNAGKSWISQQNVTKQFLYDITFSDSNSGIAVGAEGTLLKTIDGGEHWTAKSSSSKEQLRGITLNKNNIGYAVGIRGTLIKTIDGGESWKKLKSTTKKSLLAIVFSANKTAITVGRDETLLKSIDGGEHWISLVSGSKKSLNAIAFSDSKTGIAVGDHGAILKTSDGGESWVPRSSGTGETLDDIAFSNSKTAIAVGDGGSILKTNDGGESWASQNNTTDYWLSAIAFNNSNTGIALSYSPKIMLTSDGGDTWVMTESGVEGWLDDITFINNKTAFAVGDIGKIIKTSNAGKSWIFQNSGTKQYLYAITFIDDKTGFAVGNKGSILKTEDGGESWIQQNNATKESLRAVTFINNKTVLVAGYNGTLLKTDDAGKSWQILNSGTKAWLRAIAFSDKKNGVAIGQGGMMVKTSDGGETWHQLKYQRYPALWYWLVCIISILYVLRLLVLQSGKEAVSTETIADIFASDRPIQPGDPDPLNFGAIARGLSRFIRNPSTAPPLTVAITGAWGSGKSSLMNLLYYDLKHYGFTPVWFNAWHHQKGEQLLASLYANIRSQAIPSWFDFSGITPVGLLFRIKLIIRRCSKHWGLTAVLIILPVAVFTYLIIHPAQLNSFEFDEVLKATENADKNSLIIALLSSLPTLGAIISSLRAFGVNPARLIALGSNEKTKSTHIDPSARQHFANEFKQVTACLELGRMVIFIDDLDRCTKENVVDILESINFLSVSGDCYIILGMDKSWVKICIEQQFPEMAKSNHVFADEYLEKLINIDIAVPTLENESSSELLAPTRTESIKDSFWKKIRLQLFKTISASRRAIVLIILAILGISIGTYIEAPQQKKTKPLTEIKVWNNVDIKDIDVINGQTKLLISISNQTTNKQISNKDSNKVTSNKNWQLVLKANEKDIKKGVLLGLLGDEAAQAQLLLRLSENKKVLITETGRTDSGGKNTFNPPPTVINPPEEIAFFPGQIDDSISVYLLPVILIICLIMVRLSYYLQKSDRIVNDSSKFRDALKIWQPWVTLNRQTPRAIKRYLNHVRYIAMRYRDETIAENAQQTIFPHFFKKVVDIPSEVEYDEETMDEPSLVALSAIFAIDKTWLSNDEKFEQISQESLEELLREKYPKLFAKIKDPKAEKEIISARSALMKTLKNSVAQHKQTFGGLTNINKKQRERFLDILAVTKIK